MHNACTLGVPSSVHTFTRTCKSIHTCQPPPHNHTPTYMLSPATPNHTDPSQHNLTQTYSSTPTIQSPSLLESRFMACVAVCCGVLQCAAVFCSAFQTHHPVVITTRIEVGSHALDVDMRDWPSSRAPRILARNCNLHQPLSVANHFLNSSHTRRCARDSYRNLLPVNVSHLQQTPHSTQTSKKLSTQTFA